MTSVVIEIKLNWIPYVNLNGHNFNIYPQCANRKHSLVVIVFHTECTHLWLQFSCIIRTQGCLSIRCVLCDRVWQPTGVFSRLDQGGKDVDRLRPGKAAGNMDVEDEDDSDGEGSVLQYAGILKKPPLAQKKEPTIKPAPTTLRRLGGKFKLPPSDTSSSPSSSANGLPPAKISVLQRLGKLSATHSNTAVSPTPADTQVNSVTSTRPKAQEKPTIASSNVSSSTAVGGAGEPLGAQMDVKAVSVFKRLGSKRT